MENGNGETKWVVDSNGELWVSPKYVNGQELKHSWLAGSNHAKVKAAGEAQFAAFDGELFEMLITPNSGHYLRGRSAADSLLSEPRGREAFEQLIVP